MILVSYCSTCWVIGTYWIDMVLSGKSMLILAAISGAKLFISEVTQRNFSSNIIVNSKFCKKNKLQKCIQWENNCIITSAKPELFGCVLIGKIADNTTHYSVYFIFDAESVVLVS